MKTSTPTKAVKEHQYGVTMTFKVEELPDGKWRVTGIHWIGRQLMTVIDDISELPDLIESWRDENGSDKYTRD